MSAEQQLHSREKGESMPQLVLQFGPTPVEPTPDTGSTNDSTNTSTNDSTSTSTNDSTNTSTNDSTNTSTSTSTDTPTDSTNNSTNNSTDTNTSTDTTTNPDTTTDPGVETTPPETSITDRPASGGWSTSAGFSFEGTDNLTEPELLAFECRLDSTSELAWQECASPAAYTALPIGQHTFEVRAIDEADNTDPSPATYTWTIVPPPTCDQAIASAAADSWIDESSQAANKGNDSVLKVNSKSSGDSRALVRFALPQVPAGCMVQSATLRLYAASPTTGRTLEALRLAASWSEGSVTWASQPSTTGPAATTASGPGYRDWTITEQEMSALYSANNGFLIRDQSENGTGAEQGFNSREKADDPPQLVVRFAPVP